MEKKDVEVIAVTSDNGSALKLLEFGVTSRPPFGIIVFNAVQIIFFTIGGAISTSFVIYLTVCAGGHEDVLARLISTSLFFCGLTTFLQVILGIRLPVTQGSSFVFLAPIVVMMDTERWRCPTASFSNGTGLNVTEQEPWRPRMAEISGCLAAASVVQVLLGFTGLIGILKAYIGPLTVTPLISLIGIWLYEAVNLTAKPQWGIAALTIGLTMLFSLVLHTWQIPVPSCNRKRGCHLVRMPVFRIFSNNIALIIVWLLCLVLTVTNVFPNDKKSPQYYARTDAKMDAIRRSPWFFFPYPGQWGPLTISLGNTAGMMAAVIATIIESVGDYQVTAQVCQVPLPPQHAMNRGIMMEGLGSVFSGLFGACHATTSYSSVIGYIAYTGVASRWVWIMSGVIFMAAGLCGKIGGVLAIVPDPIIGGMLLVSAGMVLSSSISALSTINMQLPRNLMILGVSILLGICIPFQITAEPGALDIWSLRDRGLADEVVKGNGDSEDLGVYGFESPCLKSVTWPKILTYFPISSLYKPRSLRCNVIRRRNKMSEPQSNGAVNKSFSKHLDLTQVEIHQSVYI